MGMAVPSPHWTIARVRALPDDGKRYEVIDGELFVSPSPTWEHQAAVQELLILLHSYLASTDIGRVVLSPADVEFSDDRMVEPDLFVVPLVEGRAPRDWQEAGRLLLAVEVISPGTARLDRVIKRELYRQERVPEYWIVDVASRLIERWTPADDRPEMLADKITWQPDTGHAPLELDLQDFFSAVAGP
jgi:Uma2 family endonuclease